MERTHRLFRGGRPADPQPGPFSGPRALPATGGHLRKGTFATSPLGAFVLFTMFCKIRNFKSLENNRTSKLSTYLGRSL